MFFSCVFQTCYEELQVTASGYEKLAIMRHLAKLLRYMLDMLRIPEIPQFTALCAINRIIDMCVVSRMYHPWTHEDDELDDEYDHPKTSKGDQPPHKGPFTANLGTGASCDSSAVHSQLDALFRGSPKVGRGSPKHRHSSWRTRSFTHQDSIRSLRSLINQEPGSTVKETAFNDPESCCDNNADLGERTPLEVLFHTDPSVFLHNLQTALTKHHSAMGARHKCTPSVRWRHCAYHCQLILTARILTVMSHSNTVQHKIVNEGHIKILVDSLDPNHDPVSNIYNSTVFMTFCMSDVRNSLCSSVTLLF